MLGGTIQGGKYGGGIVVEAGAVATVCDGTIQAGESGYGMGVWARPGAVATATVRIAGGMIIGGSYATSPFIQPGTGFIISAGDATITGGTFKGGFNSTSGDQDPSLNLSCGNTSIYGGTYEGNWIKSPACHDSYTKVYGKDLVLVVKDNHLMVMGTLCDGNPINVNILGWENASLEPSTVTIVNNCASFPEFVECGGKGGKSGKKTKSSLFRP